jgi:hypothetical protein
MEWIYRELSGALLTAGSKVHDDDVIAINRLINPPPVPIAVSDIYVRRCRLAGDAVDAGWGRFRTSDLPMLLEMIQGAPALVGHRKESLGVARFFGGMVSKDKVTGISYIVPKFYWMKAHSGAEDLRVNIDGGIWNEASIGFIFKKPGCSVCGEDIRRCDHVPGQTYGEQACFFHYDEIVRVTEGSIVYRGAQPGTGFSLGLVDEQLHGLNTAPRFKWKGIIYRGYPEKLVNNR